MTMMTKIPIALAFVSVLAACGSTKIPPGGGGDAPTSSGGGGAGGGVPCSDPNNPKAPCEIGGCPGTCYPPYVDDAGILPGLCQPASGCVPACKTAADCEAHHELPTCYVYGCHPDGAFGFAGGLAGCVLRAETDGTPCDFPGDNADAGVCQSGSCWPTGKP